MPMRALRVMYINHGKSVDRFNLNERKGPVLRWLRLQGLDQRLYMRCLEPNRFNPSTRLRLIWLIKAVLREGIDA